MGLAIHKPEGRDFVVADEKLWLTADRTELVAEGDPRAAFLFATPGKRIDAADAAKYGLTGTPASAADTEGVNDVEGVPTGNITTILEWVGDDVDRANRALDAELAGKNRTSLVEQLEELANPTTEEVADDDTKNVDPDEDKSAGPDDDK